MPAYTSWRKLASWRDVVITEVKESVARERRSGGGASGRWV
jgi:hypothetical protein